jgi:hypothetical protein
MVDIRVPEIDLLFEDCAITKFVFVCQAEGKQILMSEIINVFLSF